VVLSRVKNSAFDQAQARFVVREFGGRVDLSAAAQVGERLGSPVITG
jgi:hypothetical protein